MLRFFSVAVRICSDYCCLLSFIDIFTQNQQPIIHLTFLARPVYVIRLWVATEVYYLQQLGITQGSVEKCGMYSPVLQRIVNFDFCAMQIYLGPTYFNHWTFCRSMHFILDVAGRYITNFIFGGMDKVGGFACKLEALYWSIWTWHDDYIG